jgi:ABC-2 type transport system permease protein
LAAPALSASVHILAVSLIITVTAPLLFAGPLPSNWPSFFLVLLSLLLACTGLGSLIGVIAGSSRSAILWQQLIYLPSMLLGGLMLPSGMLPAGFARISRLLPAIYAMDAFLGLAWGQETLYPPSLNIAVLAAGGILAFALSALLFAWDNDSRKHPVLALLALLPYLLGALLLA